ncbi:phage virion morphogenesis protein [Pseudodesulfovibrio sp. JC047]|uniref:phage virion morphogenesis protein n=1 Tax=Pseudodesulfovibrio sp. JC047 TaxID=2683199 RepID=UPI0013D69EB8|nr:phage virion morphogenesis protein [Pseudodesulfovibrio sp. JC047]NDV20878.1 phage virion morphogenesis protein [Pseudodesulfovibrio sp. JC047]
MSMDIQVSMDSLHRLADRIAQLGDMDTRPLMDELGAAVVSQTQRRIDSEKTGPDGAPWDPWSESYAKTRHEGHSLLIASGDLSDSLEHILGISGDHAEVGSNLVYAAAQQYGLDMSVIGTHRRIQIPARPYLGISTENEEDLVALVDDFVDRKLREM